MDDCQFVLVKWINENNGSVIRMTNIKVPRKPFYDYKVGDIVTAVCPGFPGHHEAVLVGIARKFQLSQSFALLCLYYMSMLC